MLSSLSDSSKTLKILPNMCVSGEWLDCLNKMADLNSNLYRKVCQGVRSGKSEDFGDFFGFFDLLIGQNPLF